MKDASKEQVIAEIQSCITRMRAAFGEICTTAGDEMGPEVDSAISHIDDAMNELDEALNFVKSKDE